MEHLVKAGAEDLVWVVVGIFWMIAQIAGNAAKKKRAVSRPTSDKKEAPTDNPFSDFMQKLVDAQETKPQPTPQPSASFETNKRSPEVVSSQTTLHREAPPILKATPPQQDQPIPQKTAVEDPTVTAHPTLSTFSRAMPAMKLPSMAMHFQTSEKSTAGSPLLKSIIHPADKQSLRRAMLSHIIFSPPKALEQR